MVGSGAIVFAVWGYVIAKAIPDRKVGAQVRLHPGLLAKTLGESEDDVVKAIAFLCRPDQHSTTKIEQGKRLIKIGEFDYRVVNYAKYRAIRNEEERREQNRVAQAKFREKALTCGKPLTGETEHLRNVKELGQEEAERRLP